MAGSITSLGIGSGIDLESLLSNILQAEQRPLILLEGRKITAQTKISALGQVKSSISDFQTAVKALANEADFRVVSASSSNEDAFTATASSTAVKASYDLSVTQLASNNRTGTQIIADKAAALGTGSIQISVGTEAFTINIDSSNNSLEQIRDAINNDTNNTGVSANIINVDGGAKLIFTANETGLANQITIDVTDDDANNTDNAGLSQVVFGLTEIDPAQDAIFTIDGATVTRSNNEVDDVIDGVTLSLNAIGAGTLTLGENKIAARGKVSDLVDAYNKFSAAIDAQRGSSLSGEALLLTLENRVRGQFSAPYGDTSSQISLLLEVGISFDEDGIASFDESKFEELAQSNFEDLQSLFTDPDNGFVASMDDLLESYLQSDGLIDARTKGLNSTLDSIDDDIETAELRLARTEERLRAQFISLDVLTSQLSATSSFLTTQLANLPGFGNNNN